MAQVLPVYKKVQQVELGSGPEKPRVPSYDEKPEIQAIANLAAGLTPVSVKYPGWASGHAYFGYRSVYRLTRKRFKTALQSAVDS